MVMDPAICPSQMHCTAVSSMRNGKFSRLGGGGSLLYPLTFVPDCYIAMLEPTVNNVSILLYIMDIDTNLLQ